MSHMLASDLERITRPLLSSLCQHPLKDISELIKFIKNYQSNLNINLLFTKDDYPHLSALSKMMNKKSQDEFNNFLRFRLFNSLFSDILSSQLLNNATGTDILQILEITSSSETIKKSPSLLSSDSFRIIINKLYLYTRNSNTIHKFNYKNYKTVLYLAEQNNLQNNSILKNLTSSSILIPKNIYDPASNNIQSTKLIYLESNLKNLPQVSLQSSNNLAKHQLFDLLQQYIPSALFLSMSTLDLILDNKILNVIQSRHITIILSFLCTDKLRNDFIHMHTDCEKTTYILSQIESKISKKLHFSHVIDNCWCLEISL